MWQGTMGRRATDTSAACRFVLLLALLIDTSLCEVHGANTLGTFQQQSPAAAHVVEPVAPAVAANPEAQAPLQLSVEGLHEAHDALGLMSLQDHYREPLVDLCLNGANVTMEDLRKVAPQVFLRLLDNEHWREALLNRTADLPAVLGSMAAKMMQDPGHHVFMSCEKQLLQKVFPQLASTLLRNDKATSDRSASARNASSALGSSHMSEEPVSAEGVAAVLSTTKEAVARFVGGFKEAAKSANLLQDEFLAAHIASDNERGNGPAKYTKQDFEKLLRDAKRSAFEEALSPTNMLQDTDFESEEHQSIRARFGDNPMPPSLHNSTVAEKLRRINYDMFSRGVLNIVRTNSGLILALCYGSILWEA